MPPYESKLHRQQTIGIISTRGGRVGGLIFAGGEQLGKREASHNENCKDTWRALYRNGMFSFVYSYQSIYYYHISKKDITTYSSTIYYCMYVNSLGLGAHIQVCWPCPNENRSGQYELHPSDYSGQNAFFVA